ncbi:MAG: type IV pili methyl-accepting chemotaxis transducer N-terminal domain-containing protein [Burkholderiaceae bacterium]|nr:type IV pili methyl-accepting chemotaxis transducer N-terminal domain-containing protein [Burkholderiaceae bacterium]
MNDNGWNNGWNLSTKFVAVGAALLVIAITAVGLTLSLTWELEGGAAAINEGGRLRMQTYRLALQLRDGDRDAATQLARSVDESFALLEAGDPSRPLFMPRDAALRAELNKLRAEWNALRKRWVEGEAGDAAQVRDRAAGFVDAVDRFVAQIEDHLAARTAVLNGVQFAMMALALAGAIALLSAGHLFVLDPVNRLRDGVSRVRQGDYATHVSVESKDEFGQLAEGFNAMTAQLKSVYDSLERKVAEKTLDLQSRQERLAALYDITTLMARATTLEELGEGFAKRIAAISAADAVSVRWADAQANRFMLIGSYCLPQSLRDAEHCVHSGDCHCGAPGLPLRIIPIRDIDPVGVNLCEQSGFASIVVVPVRLHERAVGEVALFYRGQNSLPEVERALYEAFASHLASAIETIRLDAQDREAAVAEERQMLARELHDSIAQSLAFMKIQVQMLRAALGKGDEDAVRTTLEEIDTGVRESYGDVRELLVHFRTRTSHEDIEHALRTTLSKFEHQTGVRAALEMSGQGLPLRPDVQIQLLHVIQEALSNVRKHARAQRVSLRVAQGAVWRFEVIDDGVGFGAEGGVAGPIHVGIGIMRERAQSVGATIEIDSHPGRGTTVAITVPAGARPASAARPASSAALEGRAA